MDPILQLEVFDHLALTTVMEVKEVLEATILFHLTNRDQTILIIQIDSDDIIFINKLIEYFILFLLTL